MAKLFNQKNMPGSRTMQMRVIPETIWKCASRSWELSQNERAEPSHDSADIRPDSVERGRQRSDTLGNPRGST